MPACVDVVEQAYRNAVDVGVTEERLPASIIGRKAPRVAALAENVSAKFQGRVQGGVGDIAERAGMLENALHEVSREEVDRLSTAVNRRIYGRLGAGGELDNLTYVGPEEFAEAANGPYKDLVFASSPPEYWRGATSGTYDEINALRRVAEERKVTAEALGYPSQASRDNYLRQEWEQVDEAVRLFSDPKQGGLISPAKRRAIPVHAVGINAGLTPTSKTIGELLTDSIALWDRAIAEAFERKIVLARYGTKGGAGAITKGQAPFRHPLYRGWSADREIVNAVEGLHKPRGQLTGAVVDVAATFKNTVFGPLDIGVAGIQGLKALVTGGVQLFANGVVRSLSLLRIAPARHFREVMESGKLPLLTKMANNGLHLGLGPSAVTPGRGTIVKYIPFVGKHIDKPLSAFIDGKTRLEFGMALNWMRVQLAEGNLLMLHMTGRDINDPKVWKTAMDWANTMTGASRGAQTPGRRSLETASLTSFQMTRSEMATLGGIAKAAATGSTEERVLASMTLASVGAMVYGLGSAVNMAFGNGPVEFDPRKGDWATIGVVGQNVPIIPQRGLVRAIAKSMTALEDADFEKTAQIWAQYVLSKQGPGITGPAANLAGFGFDPNVGFRTGDLPAKYRFLNALPMPPLVSSLVMEEDSRNATSAGFQFAGFNPFPASRFELMQQARDAEFERRKRAGTLPRIVVDGRSRQPENYGELREHNRAISNEIDASPSVVAAQQTLDESQSGRPQDDRDRFFDARERVLEEFRAEQTEDDRNIEAFFRSGGESGVDPQRWRELQGDRLGDSFERREGIRDAFQIEFERETGQAPKGSVNAAVEDYFAVDVEKFTDPVTRDIDPAYYDARDRALADLAPGDRASALAVINKNRTPLQREFENLRREPFEDGVSLDDYYDIPSEDRKGRDGWRRRNPQGDAILFVTGSVTTLVGPASVREAEKIVRRIFGTQAVIPSDVLRGRSRTRTRSRSRTSRTSGVTFIGAGR